MVTSLSGDFDFEMDTLATWSRAAAVSPTPTADGFNFTQKSAVPVPALIILAVFGVGVLVLLLAVTTAKLYNIRQSSKARKGVSRIRGQLLSDGMFAEVPNKAVTLERSESAAAEVTDSASDEAAVAMQTVLVSVEVHTSSAPEAGQSALVKEEAMDELQEPFAQCETDTELHIVDVVWREATQLTPAIHQSCSSDSEFSSLSVWGSDVEETQVTPYTLTLFAVPTSPEPVEWW